MSPGWILRAAALGGASVLVLGLSASAGDVAEDVDLALVSGGRELTNSVGMKFVRLKAGKFMMGAPNEDADASAHEKPRHEVEISREFYLGVHEVTQKQYQTIMGYNPSYFSKDGQGAKGEQYSNHSPAGGKESVKNVEDRELENFAVDCVSWNNAQEFVKKLNARPEERGAGRVYRLPTEAEWEYACRAGERVYGKWHVGDELPNKLANYNNVPGRTTKVGSYPANAFGVCDMHGNVWEWCHDRYEANYYATSPKRDPQGPANGTNRILRGGCWNNDNGPKSTRTAFRLSWGVDDRNYDTGFRVVLVAPR